MLCNIAFATPAENADLLFYIVCLIKHRWGDIEWQFISLFINLSIELSFNNFLSFRLISLLFVQVDFRNHGCKMKRE